MEVEKKASTSLHRRPRTPIIAHAISFNITRIQYTAAKVPYIWKTEKIERIAIITERNRLISIQLSSAQYIGVNVRPDVFVLVLFVVPGNKTTKEL